MADRLLTDEEAAGVLGISRDGLKELVAGRVLHPSGDIGRRFGAAEVEALLNGTPAQPGPGDGPLVTAYLEEGLSVGQCAGRFQVSTDAVRRVLDSHGIPRDPQRRKPRIRIDEHGLITAYRDDGLSLRECAQKFSISTGTAARVLARHRIPQRPRPRSADHDEAIISACRDEDLSLKECARKLGIDYETARRALRRHGIDPPGRATAGLDVDAVVSACTREGLTFEACAARFGIGKETVRRIVRRHDAGLPPDGADMLTPGQAARIAGVGTPVLAAAVSLGQLTAVRSSGGKRASGGDRRYLRREVEDLASRLSQGTGGGDDARTATD